MAQMKSMYLVFKGDWGSLTTLANESWQFGLRQILVDGAIDDVGTLPLIDVNDVNETRVETDWNINTMWTATAGVDVFHPDDYLNDEVLPAVAASWPDLISSNKCSLRTITLYPIDHTGHVVDGRSAIVTLDAPATGTSSAGLLPLEVAQVVTTRTDRLGPHGRGRFYLPGLVTGDLDTDSLFDETGVTARLAAVQTFLQGCSFSGSLVNPWNVKPIVTGSPWNNYAVIISADIGNVPDSQRRRRRQLVETRLSVPLVYP